VGEKDLQTRRLLPGYGERFVEGAAEETRFRGRLLGEEREANLPASADGRKWLRERKRTTTSES
jgi:hypothetical protein